MNVNKSTRHAKITGDFGEALVLYWLSKYGFECGRFDHTGIDIIASNLDTGERMGISVKSRSRKEGTEQDYVSIPGDNFHKAKAACKAFGCEPYFAIVVDAAGLVRVFILPMTTLLKHAPKGKRAASWKMTRNDLVKYAEDPDVKTFECRSETTRWWK